MQVGQGDWVGKVGADGMQTIGVRSKGIGIAIRIADGNARALHVATINVLQQLGLIDAIDATPLAPFARSELRNLRSLQTGQLQAAFQLPRLQ
jgi:L-asparaginase II